MKLTSLSLFCCLFCAVSSCTDKRTTYYADSEIIDGSTVIDIPTLKDSTIIACSSVFSDVEYIPLETNSYSALGMIDKLEFTEDGDMIVFDERNGIVMRYDRDGHYMNKIGERGHQKNEYVKPIDMAYDSFHKQVIIWDNFRKTLLYYDINGNLVDKTESDLWYGKLEVLDNDNLVICDSHKIKDNPNALKFFLVDRKGKIRKEFNEYNTITGFQKAYNKVFSKCDGHVLCHTEYSSNIFEFQNDSLVPRYHLSFGKNGIPDDWFGYDEDKFHKMIHTNDNITYCNKFFETSKYIITTLSMDCLYLCIKEKKEYGNKVYAGFNLRHDLCGIKIIDESGGLMNTATVVPVAVDSGKCYFVMEPSIFATFTDNLKEIKKQLDGNHQYKGENISNDDIRKFEMLAQNNNPIILKCTLK